MCFLLFNESYPTSTCLDIRKVFNQKEILVTQHSVQLALMEHDADSLCLEDSVPVYEEILPSTLIMTGLEYEAQQLSNCLFIFYGLIIALVDLSCLCQFYSQ